MRKGIVPGFISTMLIFGACTWRSWDTIYPNGQNTSSISSCDTAAVISYSANIVPILNTFCSLTSGGCHNGSSLGPSADNYSQFNIFRGDANSGLVMQRLDLPSSDGHHMPLSSSIPPCDTLKIRKWIKNGCLNN